MSTTSIDEAKLGAFMGQAVTDMGATISAPLFQIGEKLGLYKQAGRLLPRPPRDGDALQPDPRSQGVTITRFQLACPPG
jgi:hypothetical protein